MEKIVIHCTTEIVHGGCNVCPTTATPTYDVEIAGKTTAIPNLDVVSLLRPILREHGYKERQEYDVAGDYDVFENTLNTVNIFESYQGLRFETQSGEKEVKQTYESEDELFKVVNELLTDLFKLEAIEFVTDIPEN
ncbi:hypothetical protein BW731_07570 [Vagococcus martis]|uniref:DUF4809 domain-containing protein n=1 Tax=Vagococcus martis TaxID=1768210 RepID=A0A1V4DHY8_9ENTE|nr:DUF4809 family protein [Vagococcus martis]OPF88041.1 hypothetical protein BW731_07570 [Vagococcus martis]